ncbi:MAG: hypothetical protein HY537_18495 [Deltaproteobacteria bacterium]|nr:hypothetical protein [Deltaproteobacteria bacterium]
MTYKILLVPFVLFLALLTTQAAVSRIYRPRSEDRFIFSLYLGLPFLVLSISIAYNFWGLLTPCEAFLASLLYFGLGSSWIASYPAIYAACPTLIISMIVSKTKKPVDINYLSSVLNLNKNSTDRIDDAVLNGLIIKKEGKVELRSFGLMTLHLFKTYRRWLGLQTDTI